MAEHNAAQMVDAVLAAATRPLTAGAIAHLAGCSTTTVRRLLAVRHEAGELDIDTSGWPHAYRLKRAAEPEPPAVRS